MTAVPEYFAITHCAHIIQLLTVYAISHFNLVKRFLDTYLSEVLNVIFVMSTSLRVFEYIY